VWLLRIRPRAYADDEFRHRVILSGGGTFLIGLAAARGYVRKTNNMKALDGALDKLVAELQSGKNDPLRLQAYDDALWLGSGGLAAC
jgi:hypothetical protein